MKEYEQILITDTTVMLLSLEFPVQGHLPVYLLEKHKTVNVIPSTKRKTPYASLAYT
jgi:hypothetical protein